MPRLVQYIILAIAVAGSVVGSASAAETWRYEMTWEEFDSGIAYPEVPRGCSLELSDSSAWIWTASCLDKDSKHDDFVGMQIHPQAGTFDRDWRKWVAPASVGVDGGALDLIASLRPVAVWLQVFQFVEGLSGIISLSPTASPLDYHSSAGRYGNEGWGFEDWTAPGALIVHIFADGVLFLFPQGTDGVEITWNLHIWDTGGDATVDDGTYGSFLALRCQRTD
jgi:hypothetical protein